MDILPPPMIGNLRANSNLAKHPLEAAATNNSQPFDDFMTELGGLEGLGNGGATSFQNMVAMAEAQARVGEMPGATDETKRHLAQMLAQNFQTSSLDGAFNAGAYNSGNGFNALDQEGELGNLMGAMLNQNVKGFGNLMGGRTISMGQDTGKTFTPSQMAAWRQKNGNFWRQNQDQPLDAASHESGAAPKKDHLVMPHGRRFDDLRPRPLDADEEAIYQKLVSPQEPNEDLSALGISDDSKELTPEKIDKIVNKISQALNLDPDLVKAVIKTESNFNANAVSKVGAQGLMQLMPKTAKEMGVSDPFNPVENIWGGARYLKKMLDRHGGNINKALASYNWGPGNFDKYGKSGNMPTETRRYIEIVNKHYSRYKSA